MGEKIQDKGALVLNLDTRERGKRVTATVVKQVRDDGKRRTTVNKKAGKTPQ